MITLDKTPALEPTDMQRLSDALIDLIATRADAGIDTVLINANNAVCDAWTAIEDATDPASRTAVQHAAQEAATLAHAAISAAKELPVEESAHLLEAARSMTTTAYLTDPDAVTDATEFDPDEEPEIESIAGYLHGQAHGARLFGADTTISTCATFGQL